MSAFRKNSKFHPGNSGINLSAALNDEGRWEALAALYTENGRMARPAAPDSVIDGRQAILASFMDRPKRYTRHFCSNIIVDVEDGSLARARSLILLFIAVETRPGIPKLAGLPVVGEYRDRFERTAEGWRFSEQLGGLSMTS